MRIGEFAKACKLPVSVLRYYDSCGVLKPVYIDRFTGYRYYTKAQVAICDRINELKSAGFTLSEIKELLSGGMSVDDIDALFDGKKRQLKDLLRHLDEIRESVSGGIFMEDIKFEPMQENIDNEFVNDEKIVGKWEIVGEYENRNEYELGNNLADSQLGNRNGEIYFLPEGEKYWCYSWSKGKLLIDDGQSRYINKFTTHKDEADLYMFIELKAYDYMQSGRTTLFVLRRVDNKPYTAQEIARRDDIDKPFVDDEAVMGKWKAVGFVENKEDFTSEKIPDFDPYFKELEFCSGGKCISVYGDEIISDTNMQEWTKGFILRKWNSTACAYEIVEKEEGEYLFVEWKSGDYRWGGYETDYYVFERA